MDNRKYKGLIWLNVFIVLIGIGLFCVQNFILNQEGEETQYVTVYKANQDIKIYEQLTRNMFSEIKIEKDTVAEMSELITDFSKISGRYAASNILKGEYLVSSSWTSEDDEKNFVYTMEIVPTFAGDLAYGDRIDVYWLAKDNTVGLLFGNKKVYNAKTVSSSAQTGLEATQKVYIKVTKKEMLDYYTRLKTHSFIALPIEPETLDSHIVSNFGEEENYFDVELQPISYTFQTGGTLEDAAAYYQLAGFGTITIEEILEYNSDQDLTGTLDGMTIMLPVDKD